MVYGKRLGEFVNVHKLQWERGRSKQKLCESSVVHFWHEWSSLGNQLADYTMLYFENSRVSQTMECKSLQMNSPFAQTC